MSTLIGLATVLLCGLAGLVIGFVIFQLYYRLTNRDSGK